MDYFKAGTVRDDGETGRVDDLDDGDDGDDGKTERRIERKDWETRGLGECDSGIMPLSITDEERWGERMRGRWGECDSRV